MNRSCKILGYPCKIYRNLGGFKFEDVTDKVLKLKGDWFYTHGAAVTDYDCDGYPDLLLTGWGRVALFHNEKDPDDPTKRILVERTKDLGLDKVNPGAAVPPLPILTATATPTCTSVLLRRLVVAQPPELPLRQDTDVCPPRTSRACSTCCSSNKGGKNFVDVTKEAGPEARGQRYRQGTWASSS